jgi:hypothetical protein
MNKSVLIMVSKSQPKWSISQHTTKIELLANIRLALKTLTKKFFWLILLSQAVTENEVIARKVLMKGKVQ